MKNEIPLIGWKKSYDNKIIKLLIPTDARIIYVIGTKNADVIKQKFLKFKN